MICLLFQIFDLIKSQDISISCICFHTLFRTYAVSFCLVTSFFLFLSLTLGVYRLFRSHFHFLFRIFDTVGNLIRGQLSMKHEIYTIKTSTIKQYSHVVYCARHSTHGRINAILRDCVTKSKIAKSTFCNRYFYTIFTVLCLQLHISRMLTLCCCCCFCCCDFRAYNISPSIYCWRFVVVAPQSIALVYLYVACLFAETVCCCATCLFIVCIQLLIAIYVS